MDANPIETGVAIDMGVVRGLITVLTFVVFLGITWWAYHKENRARFDADAMMPFAGDDEVAQTSNPKEGRA